MQDSKKAFLVSVAFLLVVILLSLLVIEPYLQSEALYWEDSGLRRSMGGSLDCVIVGASHCVRAFIPAVIDREAGCRSYNLGGSLMTFSGRKALLEKELSRNPVSTVVIEISYNAITRNEQEEYGEGDTYVLSRLDSFPERVSYLLESTRFSDYEHVYSLSLFLGMTFWGRLISKEGIHNVSVENRGYSPSPSRDLTLPEAKYAAKYNTMPLNTDYRPENLRQLEELVRLCEAYGAEPVIAVVPVSNLFVWMATGWDDFTQMLSSFCSEHHCRLYDFNLIRSRYELFSDADSFSDDIHMSDSGAETFSALFAEILCKVRNGEDCSALFFQSYDELKQQDPAYRLLPAE